MKVVIRRFRSAAKVRATQLRPTLANRTQQSRHGRYATGAVTQPRDVEGWIVFLDLEIIEHQYIHLCEKTSLNSAILMTKNNLTFSNSAHCTNLLGEQRLDKWHRLAFMMVEVNVVDADHSPLIEIMSSPRNYIQRMIYIETFIANSGVSNGFNLGHPFLCLSTLICNVQPHADNPTSPE
ncbi:hypothetical protein J6590_026793 [Homalodisca vitripennis]|nr:hypothetical protein J6590_026793 [Homalodisca vitripennis]